jgi:hypothetical protein
VAVVIALLLKQGDDCGVSAANTYRDLLALEHDALVPPEILSGLEITCSRREPNLDLPGLPGRVGYP